jgi:hypothetical protein
MPSESPSSELRHAETGNDIVVVGGGSWSMQRHKPNLQYPIEASKWLKMSRGTVVIHRARAGKVVSDLANRNTQVPVLVS